MTARPIRGYVFDAYGTLFDVHSVVEVGREVTADPMTLSVTWRQKQLEYTWLRALIPEVPDALARLAPRPRAILSNGSPRMLQAAVASSGLGGHLEHVLSVDAVKTYKPAPQVYALGPRSLGLPVSDLLFVSSNAWDLAGAKAFGYRVAWCNRGQAPADELGLPADLVVTGLDQLPDVMSDPRVG